jgi:Tol biopolymer transport system component/predicted Ser/Thr protein kinase
MALTVGTQLGSHEITALLGKGGMGEVYRARDLKLKREVAIKILPEEFSRDADRVSRFQREAEVLASLNHPNIASIYDLAEASGTRFLVLELVEGETLGDRIARGPIPVEEALTIAKQICEALETAHEKGIIHRDLKPANVKLTPEGKVKVLDFGLAKAMERAPTNAMASNSPTLLSGTIGGMLIGTAGYMSPEQAAGKPVDKRADIWSFGVVLWEMLAGEQLFKGETVSHILASVLKDEPDPSRVPLKARRLLQRCLEKDPKKRLRDIGEAPYLLDDPAASATAQRKGLRHAWLGWAVAGMVLTVVISVSFVRFRGAATEIPLMTASVAAPRDTAFDLVANTPALSPDGRWMAFAAHGADGKRQLWVRLLATASAQPLAGTEGARFPFWSPDSRSVAFFADGRLKRVDCTGGPVQPIADAPVPRGGSWNTQGIIVFGGAFAGPLLQVTAGGGTPRSATMEDSRNPQTGNPNIQYFPWFLPDGRHFLFVGGDTLRIGALDSREAQTIGPANSNGVYANGYLLYLRENALMAQPFDEKRLVVTGEAAPIAAQVASSFASGAIVGMFSVSREGMLLYQAGAGGQQLMWFDRGGKVSATLGEPGDFISLAFSRDQQSLVLSRRGRNRDDLWIYDLARGVPTVFTSDQSSGDAIYSPDGRTVVYTSGRTLYLKTVDGTRNRERLYEDGALKLATSWSANGKFLLYMRNDPKTLTDIWVMSMGPGAPMPHEWLATAFNESLARFSPDGNWVAYQSDESGESEIYVAPFPGPGRRRRVSQGGGRNPRWRADGKEIFYIGANGKLAAAEVAVSSTDVAVGTVHPMEVPGHLYEVSADGQRFLVALPVEQTAMTLVQNWPEVLRKK